MDLRGWLGAAAILGLGGAAAVLGAWLFLVPIPLWLVSFIPVVGGLSDREYAEAVAEARAATLQLIAGLAVAGGLLFTALQVRQRRAEQSAELFLNAIEKLADERVEAQLYAIQGLDRVADLSGADRMAVERILAQFIRNRGQDWMAAARRKHGRRLESTKTSPQRLSDPPFQAALETLGRRRSSPRKEPLDLEGLSLVQPHFDGLNFERVCLRNARLSDGHFNRASFESSSLRNASVYGELRMTDFRGADLRGASISGQEGFTDGIRFEGAFYNAMTSVEPVELADLLLKSGHENDDPWPVIDGCR